jgi:hypothetical protein
VENGAAHTQISIGREDLTTTEHAAADGRTVAQ